MKKFLIVFIILIMVIISLLIVVFVRNSGITGKIINIDSDNRIITIKSNDQEVKLVLNNKTKMLDTRNQPTLFSDFNIGFEISATLEKENNSLIVKKIKIEKAPNIIILSPEDKNIIKDVLKIEGIARVFENVLQIEVKNNESNEIIHKETVMASPLDIGLFGPFSTQIDLTKYLNLKNIEVSAFQYSAKDGSVIDKTTINLDVIK